MIFMTEVTWKIDHVTSCDRTQSHVTDRIRFVRSSPFVRRIRIRIRISLRYFLLRRSRHCVITAQKSARISRMPPACPPLAPPCPPPLPLASHEIENHLPFPLRLTYGLGIPLRLTRPPLCIKNLRFEMRWDDVRSFRNSAVRCPRRLRPL